MLGRDTALASDVAVGGPGAVQAKDVREVNMQRKIATLSGLGLLGALVTSSCIVERASNEPGGSTASGGSLHVVDIRGGATNTVNGYAGIGASAGSEPAPCEGLLEKLKTDPSLVCSQKNVKAVFSKINLLIVLDKSGSMSAVPEGYVQSKWAGAVDALKTSLDPASSLISYGLLLYPYAASSPAKNCELGEGQSAVNIAVGPAGDTVPQINALMAATIPGGGTPAAAALGAALDYYTIGDGAALEGAKYVLLVTDGGPNCNPLVSCGVDTCTAFMDKSPQMASCWNGGVANCCDRVNQVNGGADPHTLCLDDDTVTVRLDALRAKGISTFVIGIPGSEVYAPYLDGFADSGGVPVVGQARKYYEVNDEAGLAKTFDSITRKLVDSCVVRLDEPPMDLNKINVAVDCNVLPQKTGDQLNWSYDGANTTIEIQGGTCERIKTLGVNRIDIINGCYIVNPW